MDDRKFTHSRLYAALVLALVVILQVTQWD